MQSHPIDPAAHSPSLPCVGETFDGKYRIDGILGTGGMGIVFAATHLRLDERVAIKMLLPEWLSERTVVERFGREGRASAAIHSEHVVRVLDVHECEGQPYLVLEYLEGKDLEALVAAQGKLPVRTAVDYVLQACEALAQVHVVGTIHRDLKPANLFLTHRADGSACIKVLDFGISKVRTRIDRCSGIQANDTVPLTVMGSPHYMSPEQMRSAGDVDARTDIWALGAILHELLAGAPPFDAETITALCAHVFADPAPHLSRSRGDLPNGLEDVVLRCLEKEPENRYTDVAALTAALGPFGSEASRMSVVRVQKIFGREVPPSVMGAVPRVDATDDTVRMRLADTLLPAAGIRRPFGGYLLATLAALLLLGGVGWTIARQEVAVRGAERSPAVVGAAPVSPVASSEIPPVPAPAPEASSQTTITGAVLALPAPAPPSTTTSPVDVSSEPPPATVPGRAAHHHHAHHAPPEPQTVAALAASVDLTSLRGPGIDPPVGSPPPAPAPAPAVDPSTLFEERK